MFVIWHELRALGKHFPVQPAGENIQGEPYTCAQPELQGLEVKCSLEMLAGAVNARAGKPQG